MSWLSKLKDMRSFVVVLFVALAAMVACGAAAGNNDRGKAPLRPKSYDPQLSFAPLVETVAPAVVNIQTARNVKMPGAGHFDIFEFFFGPRGRGRPGPSPERFVPQRSLGSGFVIDRSGLVVTNHHVVHGANEIVVMLSDDRKFDAEVVGSDERTDVALLRLKDAKNLPAVDWGDSDVIRVGDHVVAIGNPFGLDHTVTTGIVSAKERVIGAGPYDAFIQTDASINPGNSGGPLFDLAGRVVGINTAIAPQGQGIGFAIPSNLARGIIDSLRSTGTVVRGWLGVGFQHVDEKLARAFGLKKPHGALVATIEPGSPADKAGLRPGDIIVKVGGKKLKASHQLPSMVAALEPGRKTTFEVVRESKRKSLKVIIGTSPYGETPEAAQSSKGKPSKPKLGLELRELSPDLKRRLDAKELDGGVVVVGVRPSSPFARELREGDVIVEVNHKPTKTAAQFKKIAGGLKQGDDVLLRIFRSGGFSYLVVRL